MSQFQKYFKMKLICLNKKSLNKLLIKVIYFQMKKKMKNNIPSNLKKMKLNIHFLIKQNSLSLKIRIFNQIILIQTRVLIIFIFLFFFFKIIKFLYILDTLYKMNFIYIYKLFI